MRFICTPDQREFFRKNRFIEFQDLLSPGQAASLAAQAEELLGARLQIPPSKWETVPTTTLYKAGYDLWRDIEAIKKATQKLSIAHIASELFATSPLRIAFDQLCVGGSASLPFQSNLSLIEISSVKPLAGGILFPLEDTSEQELQNPAFPLPKKAGNALFFSATLPIPWPLLFSAPRLRFLLVAFAPAKSFYLPEPRDPHSPVFKKRGYVFNDLLKEALHPLVYGKK